MTVTGKDDRAARCECAREEVREARREERCDMPTPSSWQDFSNRRDNRCDCDR